MTPREQLILYAAIGYMMMNDQKTPPTPPKVDPEWQEGFDFAETGGKMKRNPYEGGSIQWWAWHSGYKAAKKLEAERLRRPGAARPQ